MENLRAKYSYLPSELQKLTQWGIFHKKWVESRHKYTKIPLDPWTGKAGSSTDQNKWSDFQTALRALEKYSNADGLAFYFANGYCGLDIDHVGDELEKFHQGDRDPENMINKAKELTKNTYMETSISGEGIHCIFKGKIPGSRRRRGNYEMYESGRFFALTGDSIQLRPEIKSLNKAEMQALYKHYLGADKEIPMPVQNINDFKNDLSVSEIIRKIDDSSQHDKFQMFMTGGWNTYYPSQSEADLAFANMLAFWTGKDFDKMDEIFRHSSLMRDKYDQKHGKTTYGIALLNKAINDTTETYNPHHEDNAANYVFGKEFKEHLFGKNPIDIHRPHSWDDMGNAQRFLDHYGKIVHYSYIDKKWYVYNGSFWEMDQKGIINSLADNVVNDLKHEKVVIENEGDSEEDALKAWTKFKKKCRSNAGKKNMITEVQHHVSVMHEDFDKENMLLNTPSGYVDLTDGTLHEHDLKKMFSKETNAEYTENIDCPQWITFLNQIFDGDQEMIAFMQRAFGYSLTGSTQEQVAFFCLGEGQNGKSVCLNTVGAAAGSYAKTMNVSSVMLRNQSSGANSDIARLEGARMVISSEANEGSRLDESLLKQITGGDKVVARYQYGSEFEFNPKFKLWMATNHRPFIRGTDNGIWRRIILIPFNVQIPKEKVDKNLSDKLKRELPGILNWMVEGAMMWQREGLNIPRVVQEATNQYRKDMDVVDLFINDECEVNANYQEKSSVLYQTYKEWANDNSEYRMSSQKFNQEMRKKYQRKLVHGVGYFQGLRIRRDPRDNFLRDLNS